MTDASPAIEVAARALHRLKEGLQMGWKAGNLLAQKWELAWERPLNAWRDELGIAPTRDGGVVRDAQ